jgi:hypothetical protein
MLAKPIVTLPVGNAPDVLALMTNPSRQKGPSLEVTV